MTPAEPSRLVVDTAPACPLPDLPAAVRIVDEVGYRGVWFAETIENPLLPLLLCGEHSQRLDLVCSVSVAFARTPLVSAYDAAAVARLAPGRLVLGLGSQVRPVIRQRFSMPWSDPVARMRDYVAAVRAIWRSWQHRTPLRYRGTHYRHTSMPSFFMPPIEPLEPLPVYLAGVGPRMTALAGEIADGYFFHSFTTPDYLAKTSLPMLRSGMERSGTGRHLAVAGRIYVATGFSDEEHHNERERIRVEIAFHGSTPAYRSVLDLHGLGDVHYALRSRALRGDWSDVRHVVDDQVVDLFAVSAEPDAVPAAVLARWGGLADRLCIPTPPSVMTDPAVRERWAGIVGLLARAPAAGAVAPVTAP